MISLSLLKFEILILRFWIQILKLKKKKEFSIYSLKSTVKEKKKVSMFGNKLINMLVSNFVWKSFKVSVSYGQEEWTTHVRKYSLISPSILCSYLKHRC